MNRSLIILLIATLSALAPQSAHADSDKDRALALFENAKGHYGNGDFQMAADLLRQAYELHHEAILLYNLARSLESLVHGWGHDTDTELALSQVKEAIWAYETYLKSSKKIEDRGAINKRIESLRYRLSEHKKAMAAQMQADMVAEPARSENIVVAPAASRQSKANSKWAWTVTVGGVGILGVGAVVGAFASKRHDEAVAERTQRVAAQKQESSIRLSRTSTALLIGGGIATAVGVTWVLLERGEQEPARRPSGASRRGPAVSLQISPNMVSVLGSF